MEKQTKNVITREWVEKELRFYNTADIRSTLVWGGAVSLVTLPLAVFLIRAILTHLSGVFSIAYALLIGVMFISPTWVFLFGICKHLAKRKMLQKGEFEIVERAVLYKKEKLVHRHTEECLCFLGFKERSVNHTTYQLASKDDVFYVVYYKPRKDIEMLYSAKMYEYREN